MEVRVVVAGAVVAMEEDVMVGEEAAKVGQMSLEGEVEGDEEVVA